MSTEHWHPITRGLDREIVRYLDPFDTDYAQVQPRSVLGHPVGKACDFIAGEERLLERGIRELAEYWQLTDLDVPNALTILEVSADGIVVADALATKALISTERFRVAWPDVTQRLVPWDKPTDTFYP